MKMKSFFLVYNPELDIHIPYTIYIPYGRGLGVALQIPLPKEFLIAETNL